MFFNNIRFHKVTLMRVVVNLNFLECYKILGITEECDWATFRKNYKSLIQQHHPDRFSENTPEHASSEKAIRYYNAAYKIIFDYYQLNKSLPPRSEHSTITNNPEPPKRKKRPPVTQPKLREKEQPKAGPLRHVLISTVLLSVFSIFVYQIPSEEMTQIKQTEPVKNLTKIYTENKDTNIETPTSQSNHQEQYYSIGSSIGEVIILEGKPNQIIDTTWYYGKSSITFTNGVVSSWIRHPSYPLKISRDQLTPFNFDKPAKPSIPNTKKPYWQR